MENFTAGHNRNYTSTSIQSSTLPIGFAEFLFALNIFLSIATSLSNILILIALCKASSLHPPTKLLFRCLAVTDLCVGLVTHPALSAFVMLYLSHTRDINASVFYFPNRAANASGFVFCEASIMVSTAISVDRRQTSRFVVGAEIPTCRNPLASSCSSNFLMVSCYFYDLTGLFLEIPFCHICIFSYWFAFFGHFNLFLHKYLPLITTTSSPSSSEW